MKHLPEQWDGISSEWNPDHIPVISKTSLSLPGIYGFDDFEREKNIHMSTRLYVIS